MKYYKQLNANEELVALCSCNDDSVPIGVTELTGEEYKDELRLLAEQDAKAEAKRKSDEEAAQKAIDDKLNAAEEARKKAEEDATKMREEAVGGYAAKVKAKEIGIADVPEEYRSDVSRLVDPPTIPPSNEELNVKLEAAQEAIDFLMTTVAGGAE